MDEPRFDIPLAPFGACALLERELGVSAPVAQVLVRRGLGDPDAARAFLAADERHDHSEFAGMEEAVALALGHVERRSRIVVHGDYDCDGVSSTAILVRVLRSLDADVGWFIPGRSEDGYGLSAATVERLVAAGAALIITVDCGITSVEEVALARQLGADVLVTDHHAPRADGALPQAPIIHPGLSAYPFTELCAAAVAYKLAGALLAGAGRDPIEADVDLDIVALATVADCVPLIGENRRLVREGLVALSRTQRPGLRGLMQVTQTDPTAIDEQTVAFRLAPRINAAGRLRRADAGVELLLTVDEDRATAIAQELDAINAERRHVETRTLFEAEAQVATMGERPAYVLAGEEWHPGVIGIVASRLAERHNRPFVLVAFDGERGTGSGRSIPVFDLLAGLDACAAHLLRHGGHRAAAGCTVERAEIDAFRAAFEEHADEQLRDQDLSASERIDAVVSGGEIGLALAEELRSLAPFGIGNPPVALLVPAARFDDARTMGEGKHVRFTLLSGGARASAVAFGRARLPDGHDEAIDAAFALEINRWNGREEPRLVLRAAARPVAGRVTFAGRPQDDLSAAFAEFDAAGPGLTADPALSSAAPEHNVAARRRRVGGPEHPGAVRDRRGLGAAGTLGALLASGEPVLVVCACESARRDAMDGRVGDVTLCSFDALQRGPRIADAFTHVVVLDPPPSAEVEAQLRAPAAGQTTHLAWDGAGLRFMLDGLDDHTRLRADLAALYRQLRDGGPDSFERAVRDATPARCGRLLRVLHDVRLVEVDVAAGSVVMREPPARADLAASTAFDALLAAAEGQRRWLTRSIDLAA